MLVKVLGGVVERVQRLKGDVLFAQIVRQAAAPRVQKHFVAALERLRGFERELFAAKAASDHGDRRHFFHIPSLYLIGLYHIFPRRATSYCSIWRAMMLVVVSATF